MLLVDQLPYDWGSKRRYDEDGNLVETRSVQDGREFDVVKNFPREQEVVGALKDVAQDIQYREYPRRETGT